MGDIYNYYLFYNSNKTNKKILNKKKTTKFL